MQWSHPAAISQSINVTTFLWKTYPLIPSFSYFCSCSSNPFVIDYFVRCTWLQVLILKPTGLAWSPTNQVTLAPGWKEREVQSASSSLSPRLKLRWWAVGIQPMWLRCLQSPNAITEKSYLKWHVLWRGTLIVMLWFVRKHVRAIIENQIPIVTDEFKI